ncbi:hypothetical protein [Natronorarus salvus]|uniref:hypothetical protein n=1 Tax=Natronorarus salvus TaxID=3117733 RepID=UPI002F26A798
MRQTSDESGLERESVQWLVREAVKAGMESPLRDSILEAVDETTEEEETTPHEEEERPTGGEDEPGEKDRLTKVVQGLVVFVVMFVILYTTLRRLTDDED